MCCAPRRDARLVPFDIDKAELFRNALGFPIEPPNHVTSVCASTDETPSEPLFSGESETYCVDIHGGAPPPSNTPSSWTLLEWLTALAHVATILGVPIFLVTHLGNLIAERRRAEYGTYDALDEKHVEFQKLAVQYPHLDIADSPLPATDVALSPTDLAIRRTLYQILLATFERAYLMYRGKSGSIRKRQWAGWDTYVRAYCARPAFVDAFFMGTGPSWDYTATFDRDFETYLKKLFAAHNYLPPR